MDHDKATLLQIHQETGKGYVLLTKGYGGYTCHVTISIVLVALVSPCSLDAGIGSTLYVPACPP